MTTFFYIVLALIAAKQVAGFRKDAVSANDLERSIVTAHGSIAAKSMENRTSSASAEMAEYNSNNDVDRFHESKWLKKITCKKSRRSKPKCKYRTGNNEAKLKPGDRVIYISDKWTQTMWYGRYIPKYTTYIPYTSAEFNNRSSASLKLFYPALEVPYVPSSTPAQHLIATVVETSPGSHTGVEEVMIENRSGLVMVHLNWHDQPSCPSRCTWYDKSSCPRNSACIDKKLCCYSDDRGSDKKDHGWRDNSCWVPNAKDATCRGGFYKVDYEQIYRSSWAMPEHLFKIESGFESLLDKRNGEYIGNAKWISMKTGEIVTVNLLQANTAEAHKVLLEVGIRDILLSKTGVFNIYSWGYYITSERGLNARLIDEAGTEYWYSKASAGKSSKWFNSECPRLAVVQVTYGEWPPACENAYQKNCRKAATALLGERGACERSDKDWIGDATWRFGKDGWKKGKLVNGLWQDDTIARRFVAVANRAQAKKRRDRY